MSSEFKKENIVKRALKIVLLIVNLIACMICATWILFTEKDILKRRHKFCKNASFWCARGVRILGIKIKLINKPKPGENYLVLCNHMGIMDILTMASVMEGVFVTSQEMRETPVLGKICEMGGCIFIERRTREQIPNEIRVLSDALINGFNIILFPEGTSGDGSRILPLKKSFVLAGQGTGKNVLPVVVNYITVNGGLPFTHQFRDHLCWYGDMGFGSSMWRLTELKSVEATLEFATPIVVTETSHRRHVAAEVQQFMEEKFVPVEYPAGTEPFDLAAYLARQKAKASALRIAKDQSL